MPSIKTIREGSHDGEDGFIVEWKMFGFNEGIAKFRASGMTAMRFPTTITDVSVVGVENLGERVGIGPVDAGAEDHIVSVFVPTEGFPSAGIQNPLDWLQEQFSGDRLRIKA